MPHANARLSPFSRLLLVQRVAAGRPIAHVAAEMGVSRSTAHKWVRRFAAEGQPGLVDRSSRPLSSPRRLPERVEQRVLRARARERVGAARIGWQLGLNPSTVGRVLARHQVPRLSWLDPVSGTQIKGLPRQVRRYQHDHPGSMIHVDMKKLGRIPPGGGWRLHGRDSTVAHRHKHVRIGYEYVHAAVDDATRIAYVEVLDAHTGPASAAFLARAIAFFNALGIAVERVLTDNAREYVTSRDFQGVLAAHGITHKKIRPGRPQTNGKVERLNQTLAREWAYQRPWTSNTARRRGLARWLHTYNHRRPHHALAGATPISRLQTT